MSLPEILTLTRRPRGRGAFALAFLLGACARPAPLAVAGSAAPMTPIILQADWYAQAEQGGYYQAVVKGYYHAAGLDVRIVQAGPDVPVDVKLATGVVQFCLGRGDDTIVEIARDIPIVIVAATMQHDLEALMLHPESPVNSFRDLDGKTIMTTPSASWISYIQSTYHVRFSVLPINFGIAQFMADPNFIQQCFVTYEPYYAELNGVRPKTLLLSAAGYDFYRVLSGNADWVAKHPAATRAFVAASIRGWDDYLNGDPTPANREILAANVDMKQEFLDYAIKAMKQYRLVSGDAAKGEGIGQLSPRRLQDQIDILASLGLLDHAVTVNDIADLRFSTPR